MKGHLCAFYTLGAVIYNERMVDHGANIPCN